MVQTQEQVERATALVEHLADRMNESGMRGFNEVMSECGRSDLILLILTLLIDSVVSSEE